VERTSVSDHPPSRRDLAKQDGINADLRTCIQEQQAFNRSKAPSRTPHAPGAIERLDVTQARSRLIAPDDPPARMAATPDQVRAARH